MLYLIADMFSKIKVGAKRKKPKVIVFNSNLCGNALYIMQNLGYISSYQILNFKYIKIQLRYISKKFVIELLTILSRPKRRYYMKVNYIVKFYINNKFFINGFLILSTSVGLKTDVECIMLHRGGEPFFFIG